ncbi:alpha/beta hydrolase [uncultured Rhodoblastus sp.]|uniref:alpha/beta hydrolase n=1 Tax=uncultured Rhodoblastus sp. TaxID=543037 RepID=UPI0025F1F01A|nr:alpha/beta hydrolase [uncultured Rhodoblastus sp.]
MSVIESQTLPPAAFFQPAPDQPRLATLVRPAREGNTLPGLVWLNGFRSDMRGVKASFVDALAGAQGRSLLRFDYSSHGESDGDFAHGSIGHWASEALALFRTLTRGPQVVVGSSMGGWIALLLARDLARLYESDRLAGLVLIAPAVDFTQELMWPKLPLAVREEIELHGSWHTLAPEFGESYPLTRRLFDDGRANALFGGEIRTHCPVDIIQGMADLDVPWAHAMKLFEHLASDPATLTLIKDGEHRLSRPQDLTALQKAIERIDAYPKKFP